MTPILTVHRVEHREVLHDDSQHPTGPWGSWPGKWEQSWRGLDAAAMPTPGADTLAQADHRPVGYGAGVYGFADPLDVNRWFTRRDRRQLAAHGFVRRVYRVPAGACTVLRSQVIFDPSMALRVRTDSLLTEED
jgi:hypothetical protein